MLDCCRVEKPFYVGSATAERFNRDAQGYVNQKVASSDSREASRLAQASMTVPFLPYAPEASLGDAALLDAGAGATAQEALSTWQVETSADACLAIPVPGLLLELLARRAWPVIPCLGRWLNVVARLPRSLHPGVCEKGLAEPQPHLGELSVGQLSHMIRLLRAWAPVLVREHPGQESSAETERCLQDAAQWLVNVRSALPGQHLPASGSKRMYSSLFLVKCMLMSRLVPSYVNLKELCLNAMDLLFPSLLRCVIDDLADSKHVFPGKSSKHVMRLALDVAMLLSVRRDIELDDYVRFGGADSSPQHGHNWLLSSYWSVPTQDLASLFFAVQALTEECKTRALEPEKYEQSESSRANHAQLAKLLRRQHDIPVALGQGAEDLANKCSAMAHKWAMLLGDRAKLRPFAQSFFSYTSDMGTELGIADFRVGSMTDLLPPWLRLSWKATYLAMLLTQACWTLALCMTWRCPARPVP